jgi:hypothetical protein
MSVGKISVAKMLLDEMSVDKLSYAPTWFFSQAVKLGTITADGKADVYSYAEDDMVTSAFV